MANRYTACGFGHDGRNLLTNYAAARKGLSTTVLEYASEYSLILGQWWANFFIPRHTLWVSYDQNRTQNMTRGNFRKKKLTHRLTITVLEDSSYHKSLISIGVP